MAIYTAEVVRKAHEICEINRMVKTASTKEEAAALRQTVTDMVKGAGFKSKAEVFRIGKATGGYRHFVADAALKAGKRLVRSAQRATGRFDRNVLYNR